MSHALLSPSGASRWTVCTPSARMETAFPDRSGEAAKEGTVAHELGELLIRQYLGEYVDSEITKLKTSPYYNPEMQRHAEDYRDFVLELYHESMAIDPFTILRLETRLDLTDYIPEGFGTSDTNVVGHSLLNVIDLKYGKGVFVDAVNNKQMMIYALGALKVHELFYDIETVRMTIFQPRLDNFSTFEMSASDLKHWGETELRKQAKLAFAGEGEPTAGKHCHFCKAKGTCRALADYNLELARYDFKAGRLLSDSEVAKILHKAELLTTWASAVRDYALSAALEGTKFEGWKVVRGRSTRKVSDEEALAKKVLEMGYADKDVYTKSLVGIKALETLLGKEDMAKVESYIVKPPGAPTLVVEGDKRPEFTTASAAANDFTKVEFE
ncbi:DUF2800 domain-containing protein [Siphonobacter curvatus]|uniref:DUF2800 domain-containing protein n=1 Tax=Siphonobacter curvatus TaxID=2094562 RepID=A0A2S7IR20_9BACT|nr:DUF2800 domain-containing protein [Siphonobacter curvatus]PQA60154.1 DUF2800 domain-containing protein [Siphonobacter curvatus]